GLTTFQAYRLVILPVALRLIVPPGTSDTLNLLKNSSVALTISVAGLTFQTHQIETYTARAIEAFTAGTLIYLVLCLSIATIMARVERHYAIPGLISRVKGRCGPGSLGPRPPIQVPDPAGTGRLRPLRRRHAASGHPGHLAGVRPGRLR